jgi:ABC-type molybdate transport system substrate-binding protein
MLKFIRLLCIGAVMCGLPFSACAVTLSSVTVMADSSMSMAVSEIARNYTRDRQVGVNASFAPATMQQAQINEGADADILITPLEPWIEQLKLQGLVDIHSQSVVDRGCVRQGKPAQAGRGGGSGAVYAVYQAAGFDVRHGR